MDRTYQSLKTNLLLLAAAQGMVFWYAIEKLYFLNNGISLETIVIIGIFAQFSKIVFELPTSVFADRWSRKGSLLASNILMVVTCIILFSSVNLAAIIAAMLTWAMCDSLRSGVYEAFTYDSLKLAGHEGAFRKVYTRMVSAEMIVMSIAGVSAGLIGHFLDLRINFGVTIIPILFAIGVLLRMNEPPITRTSESGESWLKHLAGSFRIINNPAIRWVAWLNAALMGFTFIAYEYYQLIGIDVSLPQAWFGLLIAAGTLGMAAGAEASHKHAGTKKWLRVSWLIFAATLLIGFRFKNPVIAVGMVFMMFFAIRMLRVYVEVYLQNHIPSARRATIFSLIGTLSYACFFAFALIFAFVVSRTNARLAYTIAGLPILLFGLIDILRGPHWSYDKKPALMLEETDHVH